MPEEIHAETDDGEESHPNEEASRAGLWRIAGIAVAVAVTIVGVAYLYVKEAERVTFITVNLLSLSVLTAIVVQAYIYKKQWDAMEGQLGYMRQSIDEAKISREIENRAYIALSSIISDRPFSASVHREKLNVKLVFYNAGKTPARNVRAKVGGDFSRKAHDVEILLGEVKPETQSYFVVLPALDYTAHSAISLELDIKKILGEKLPHLVEHPQVQQIVRDSYYGKGFEIGRFYVCGNIVYEDIFGREWESTFCYFAHGLDNATFGCCTNPAHNTFT